MVHYYSPEQKGPLRLKKIKARVLGNTFDFYTAGGVFSKDRLDKGTEILINNAIIKNNWKILDLGCGWGVVGIVIKKLFPECDIVMTDINKRAVKLSRMNARLNNVDVKILQGDMYEKIKGKFNTILLNPPQVAGKKICFEMIEQSKSFLKEKGLLQVVARHNKGGKEFSRKINEVFGNIKEIAKKAGYRVYVGEN